MTLLNLIQYYTGKEQIFEAINVLKSLEWNCEECLQGLYHIYRVLILRQHSEKTECELQSKIIGGLRVEAKVLGR